jgi:hypothetical protein
MSQTKIIKTSLVNIDSSYRTVYPKNVCTSNVKTLPENPLTFSLGSNTINFYYPDHNLKQGDNIIVQNVEGITKTIINSVYLFKDFKYAVFVFSENNINPNYKQYFEKIFCNISLVGDQQETNAIGNIRLNDLIGIKSCLIASQDLPLSIQSSLISNNSILSIMSSSGSNLLNLLDTKCILIELPVEYDGTQDFYQLNQVFKINYLHIGGIPLGYLNANYPINYYNYQSSFEVDDIVDSDNFTININLKSFINVQGGGNNILVSKIINTIIGYPDADDYVVNLKKSFNNVTNIELVSTEFPYVDLAIKKDINDKLYWKNIDDGEYIYSVTVDEGFYSSESFLKNLTGKINSVKRVNSNLVTESFNNFEITIQSNIQKITFKPYNLTKLPNSLSVSKKNINDTTYFILTVSHPNNLVTPGDYITIYNASNVSVTSSDDTTGETILAKQINKEHIVYEVNFRNFTYDIILGSIYEISYETTVKPLTGGENITIKSKTKVSLLFDKTDTCGEIIGFRDVGNNYSIIDFNSEITNYDSYINSINLNPVGNLITYNSNFMNFVGKYNYFLMYLNDIEYLYSNNNLKSCFAKIQLSGNPGDILFNTFVSTPSNIYFKGFPIPTLTDLTIKFIYPDGSRINFRNINHSFTLKITEEQLQNDNTYLNSQNISVIDEFKKANLKE